MQLSLTQIAIMLFLIMSPFIIIFAIYAWNWFTTDFLFLGGATTYDNSKNTTKAASHKPYSYLVPKAQPRTYLMPEERRNPPRAEFFGKFDGNEVVSQGNYEEKYLNSFELSHWNTQKSLNPSLQAASEAKPLEVADTTSNFEQNLEKSIDFA